MGINIREFEESDIPYKVKWVNDEKNNEFLHYDLPLREDKTLEWFQSVKQRNDRLDFTITYHSEPVGLIGLLDVDYKNKKAEYYITMGETKYKGKGIATFATHLLIEEAFNEYKLNKIYLYTEVENIIAQKLFEKAGFYREGHLKADLIHNDKKIDRYLYGLLAEEYMDEGV